MKNLSEEQIIKKRKEIEKELTQILKITGSDFKLEDIKKMIYKEDSKDVLHKIIAMFDNGQETAELNKILKVISDAWNYFPHQSLGGMSPAEKVLEYRESQRNDADNFSDDYEPRNEKELIKFFEGFLRMKFGDFLDEETNKEVKRREMALTEKEIEFLDKEGLLNRIFRRWLQTTWGEQGTSNYFYGETPRQELAKIRPELVSGRGYLSVKTEKINEKIKIIPCWYNEDILSMGINNLKNQAGKIVEPNLDKEFRIFIEQLDDYDKKAVNINLLKPQGDFAKYLNLFWQTMTAYFFLNCNITGLSEDEFILAIRDITNALIDFCRGQKSETGHFLKIDDLFRILWNIFQKYDKKLPAFEQMISKKGKEMNRKMAKETDFKRAVEIFYRMGVAFDRYILFPLDRYFGGAEIVWTDQQNFIGSFMITLSLLRNKGKNKRIKKGSFDLDIEDIALDLRYIWFCPPSYFRLFGPVFQYLK